MTVRERLVLALLLAVPLLAQDPPRILQIHKDRLKPGSEAAYTKIEEDVSQVCARLRCPNSYLAIRSINGPDEVWFLNSYDSDASVKKIAQDYSRNTALLAEQKRITEGKKDLVLSPQELFALYQDDLSGAPPIDLAETRFFAFTTTFDPDHLKYDEMANAGWVFRITSGMGESVHAGRESDACAP